MKMVDLFMESGLSFHDSAEVLNTILTDQPEVDYVLSGMSNEEQLLDNIRTMRDFKPLSDDERVVIEQVIGVLAESRPLTCHLFVKRTSCCAIFLCLQRTNVRDTLK